MINIESVILEVRRLAQVTPENKYLRNQGPNSYQNEAPMCSYVHGANSHTDKLGCIFGQALNNLGLTIIEDKGTIEALIMGSSNLVHRCTGLFNNDNYGDIANFVMKLKWCKVVQEEQDKLKTWAEAIEVADNSKLVDKF